MYLIEGDNVKYFQLFPGTSWSLHVSEDLWLTGGLSASLSDYLRACQVLFRKWADLVVRYTSWPSPSSAKIEHAQLIARVQPGRLLGQVW